MASEEQKARWLPPIARLETIGPFALTEPDHGSDSVARETTARRGVGAGYVLNGRKRWIGNASLADVTIVWARDSDGDVGAYVVEKGTPGFDASALITGKIGKRAVWQPDVTLVDVRVPAENKLAGAHTFRDAGRVLNTTRGGAAWECVGHVASLAKLHNVRKAKEVCSAARDILGGNGLLLDYHVARHLTDMEVVDTYEGTDTIQSLIVGRDVTGISAFA